MSKKFGRNYRITIDPKDGGAPIVITMPFTIRFWINRQGQSSLNTMSLDIYNLSQANRARIYQDNWNVMNRTIIIEMGYDNLYRVFSGTIQEANSAREGVDEVTRIEAWDNLSEISQTQTYQSLDKGQSVANIIKFLIGQFTVLKTGAVGDFPGTLPRSVALNGSTWDLLKKYSSNQAYIDDGKIYVLQDAEVVGTGSYNVDDSTGLLGTPRRSEGTLTVPMILETGIPMFGMVKLTSTVNPVYNGTYKVQGIRHEGTISGAINGQAITTLTLLAPNKFRSFVTVPTA